MEKKLPGIFAGKVDKKTGNNEDVYYSSHEVRESVQQGKINDSRNVNQKINDIFNSPNYIYKADVIIKTNSGEITKRIVGRNATHLITIENELIPLTEIKDIRRKPWCGCEPHLVDIIKKVVFTTFNRQMINYLLLFQVHHLLQMMNFLCVLQ